MPHSRDKVVEVIYYVASSLDGYIATTDGGVEWLDLFDLAGEDHGAAKLEASVDALLLGSGSYEFVLKFGQWPSSKPGWVFTKRKLKILHPGITLTSKTPRQVVKLLASRGMRRLWLMGGGKLAASFHEQGLITRCIISIFPVLLGAGIPLFATHSSPPDALSLAKAKSFKSGVVQLTYDSGQHQSKKRK